MNAECKFISLWCVVGIVLFLAGLLLMATPSLAGTEQLIAQGPTFEATPRPTGPPSPSGPPDVGSGPPTTDYMRDPSFVKPSSIPEGKAKMDNEYKMFRDAKTPEEREIHLKRYQAYRTWLEEERRKAAGSRRSY